MRKRRSDQGLTVNAIAGTHVVLLGMNLTTAARNGCLGFAIQRTDHTEGEKYWMSGMKTFKETDPYLGPGGQASSREHPFQSFQWADYSAKPNHDYTYRVIALRGTPAKLKEDREVSLRVQTEPELGKPHSAFFNRGAIASQEYARRFQNKSPKVIGAPAFRWLSRGLLEALLAFIGRAKDATYGLYGAVYEFQREETLKALKDASARGATVQIIYDAIPGASGPKNKNEAAITALGLDALCKPRTVGKIMHNKFLVLTRNGKPVAVWTGSTNWTENGIFGHANCGHIVEEEKAAGAYLTYWKQLWNNPDGKTQRAWMAQNNPNPPDPWTRDLTEVFSARTGLEVLEWYADMAGGFGAKAPLFMTFAFGMHKDFQKVYERPDGVLRFALMEKEGNGAGLAKGKLDIARIRALPNVVVAIGKSIPAANSSSNNFDRWLEERRELTADANVRYVHLKYMLVDPLGPAPIVVTGSANFSEASTNENDENMLVIRNDRRVADIYVGEFMRLYSHYAFREAVTRAVEAGNHSWKPQFLISDAGWQTDYYTPGTQRLLRREYFAGV